MEKGQRIPEKIKPYGLTLSREKKLDRQVVGKGENEVKFATFPNRTRDGGVATGRARNKEYARLRGGRLVKKKTKQTKGWANFPRDGMETAQRKCWG